MPSRPSERGILLVLAAVQFTHIMDFMVMMPLAPQLMRELDLSAAHFSHLVAAYSLAAGVVGFLSAPFIDRFDRRTLLLWAYAGFTIATLLCGLAPNAHALLIARAIGGAFGGISGSLCLAIVSDIVPPERRASGIGIVMTAFAVAASIGVPVGLQLAQNFGWRSPFTFVAVFGAIVWCVAFRFVPSVRGHMQSGANKGQAFKELLRDANAGRAIVFMAIMVLGHFSIIPLLSAHLVGDLALPEKYLSWVYVIGGIASVLTAPLVGRLADRHGRQRIFTYMVIAASLVILVIANAGALPVWGTLVIAGFFFTFASGRFVPGQAIVTLAVPSSRRGAFLSLTSCARDLASGISSTLGGWIVIKQPNGHLLHFNYLGWIAVATGLLSIVLARTVRVNDTGAKPQPKPLIDPNHEPQVAG
ncbi:MFS transporter [Nibricoccus aquaticus]|uniref:MFS transporter n=1 Tax=Nibricoccus aquaticus TaxID=2576891 RepID=A0A290QLS6_9BACT|nr:MFS transporter [Nibricoccus aquaticus]ATC65012.1 MFS transporter [Nibricoccus aquaticus]